MKAIKLLAAVSIFLTVLGAANAQTKPADLVKEWERAKAYTKEYLDAMPESGYTLKPKPDMRTFAQQMLHLTDVNYDFAARAIGQKSPYVMGTFEKSADQSKATVIKAVLDGYDYVIAGIKTLTPEQLQERIILFGKFDLSKKEVFDKCFEHQGHQRSQTVAYLHLAGVKVPAEKLF